MHVELVAEVVAVLRQHAVPKQRVDGDVLLLEAQLELGLEPPDPRRANRSALTIAASYVVGGLIPLAPYMILGNVIIALWYSIAITVVALAVFGFGKARFTGISPWKGASQTVITGGLAAAAAFGLARLIS